MGNMSETSHTCPKPNLGMMPFIIQDAAIKGREGQVTSWLENGGDINASDMGNRTLVYLACEFNQPGLLKKLLKHPEVHVNQIAVTHYQSAAMHPRILPLGIAITRGHLECVQALFNVPSLCRVSLNKKFGRDNASLIQYAGQQGQWQVVEMFLKNKFVLEGDDAQGLLKTAVTCCETDVIKDILKRDFPVTVKDKYPFEQIYERKMWEETGIETLFKKLVCKGDDSCKIILSAMLDKNDWKGLESLLKVNGAVEIRVDLAQAVRDRKSEDVAHLLSQEKLGKEVMNGALLVASIGGTTEDVVNMLLDQKYEYSIDVLNDSLILACLNGQIVLLPSLFKRESFNCTILDRAKVVSARSTVEKLIDRAIKRVAINTIPLEKGNAKEAEDK